MAHRSLIWNRSAGLPDGRSDFGSALFAGGRAGVEPACLGLVGCVFIGLKYGWRRFLFQNGVSHKTVGDLAQRDDRRLVVSPRHKSIRTGDQLARATRGHQYELKAVIDVIQTIFYRDTGHTYTSIFNQETRFCRRV